MVLSKKQYNQLVKKSSLNSQPVTAILVNLRNNVFLVIARWVIDYKASDHVMSKLGMFSSFDQSTSVTLTDYTTS